MTFTAGNLFLSHSGIGWPETSPHRDSILGPHIDRQTTYQLSYPSLLHGNISDIIAISCQYHSNISQQYPVNIIAIYNSNIMAISVISWQYHSNISQQYNGNISDIIVISWQYHSNISQQYPGNIIAIYHSNILSIS